MSKAFIVEIPIQRRTDDTNWLLFEEMDGILKRKFGKPVYQDSRYKNYLNPRTDRVYHIHQDLNHSPHVKTYYKGEIEKAKEYNLGF